MSTLIISGIVGIIGIASTIIAWKLNPKQATNRELDQISRELVTLYQNRDKALAVNDSQGLTIVNHQIIALAERREILLKRLNAKP